MKTLFVHPAIRTYHEPLFNRLGASGVEFLFSAINDPKTHMGVETAQVLSRFRHPYRQAKEIQGLPFGNLSTDLWRVFRYDVVLFSFLTSIPFLFCALPLKLLGKKVVLFDETWRYPYDVKRYKPFLPLVRFLVRRCVASFVVASSNSKTMFTQEFGVPAEKIAIAYHSTVDFGELPRDPARMEAVRARVQAVAQRRKVILYLARIVEYKGLDVLIRAVAALPESACLIVVGGGPFQAECERLVSELNLSARVHFLGSCLSDESLYYHRNADIFVLPSRFMPGDIVNCEMWGNTVNEAMSLEVPTVLTDAVGASADVIVDGVSGMQAVQGDASSLAEKLAFLLADDPRRVAIGKQGRIALLEKCNYDQNFGAFEQALRRATGTR
jgi:glycosyltransferase involved in cell wall biosynthesis